MVLVQVSQSLEMVRGDPRPWLKILPDAFVTDADRLARFTREAQTLAALNHPHIAHIHGLEESSGVRALVMELVEGGDLVVPATARADAGPAAGADEDATDGAVAEQRRHRRLERRAVREPVLQREHDEPPFRHRASGLDTPSVGVIIGA